jgi:hypothetical protein
VICRGNRTSEVFAPLFRVSLDPVDCDLSLALDGTGKTVFGIRPDFQHFNDSTGLWDYVIEPFDFRFLLATKPDFVDIAAATDTPLNVNLPSLTFVTLVRFYDDVETEVAKGYTPADFPRFWIRNTLRNELSIEITNEGRPSCHFELGGGEEFPAYSITHQSKVQIGLANEVTTFSPEDLIYPSLIGINLYATRKLYNGGTILEIGSAFVLKNEMNLTMDFYRPIGQSNSWQRMSTIPSGSLFPLPLSSERYLICDHSTTPKLAGQFFRAAPSDIERAIFKFCGGDQLFKCLKIVQDDPDSA